MNGRNSPPESFLHLLQPNGSKKKRVRLNVFATGSAARHMNDTIGRKKGKFNHFPFVLLLFYTVEKLTVMMMIMRMIPIEKFQLSCVFLVRTHFLNFF